MSPTAARARWLAVALVAVASGPSPVQGEESPDLRALVGGVIGGSEAERTDATRRLRALGAVVLPELARALPDELDDAGARAVAEAVASFGVERCIATLSAHRSRWQYAPSRESVQRLLVELRSRRDPALGIVVPLRAGVLQDFDLVPPELATPIATEIPAELAGVARPVRIRPAGLEVDARGDGSYSVRVAPGRPRVLSLGERGRERAVLVLDLPSGWHAAPAATFYGSLGKDPVEALDGDLDGSLGSIRDRVRWGDGAFQGVSDGSRAFANGRLSTYRLEERAGAPVLVVTPEPLLESLAPDGLEALQEVDRWRNANGLAPQSLDVPRSLACAKHADYLRRNSEFSHAEDPAKPGYSEEGARAGASSAVWRASKPVDAIAPLAATILHRATLLAPPYETMGAGGSEPVVIWGGGIDTWPAGTRLLVPAPGTRQVPTECVSEMPNSDRSPDVYAQPRGYPVSAHFVRTIQDLRDVRVDLYLAGKKLEPLDGFRFSPAEPYHKSRPDNKQGAYFVAKAPLLSKRRYVARVQATGANGSIDLSWAFTTK